MDKKSVFRFILRFVLIAAVYCILFHVIYLVQQLLSIKADRIVYFYGNPTVTMFILLALLLIVCFLWFGDQAGKKKMDWKVIRQRALLAIPLAIILVSQIFALNVKIKLDQNGCDTYNVFGFRSAHYSWNEASNLTGTARMVQSTGLDNSLYRLEYSFYLPTKDYIDMLEGQSKNLWQTIDKIDTEITKYSERNIIDNHWGAILENKPTDPTDLEIYKRIFTIDYSGKQ